MRLPVSLQTESKFTPYQLYKMYVGLKMHFSSTSYDFFKYNGKVRTTEEAFETRKDKYKFVKLSKHKDPAGVLVANFVINQKFWVGQIDDPESERVYTNWLRTQESLSYNFTQEMKKLFDGKSLDDVLAVPDGQHPFLLSAHLRGNVSLESITILQGILNFVPYWNDAIVDPILWVDTRNLITKYSPFMDYDRAAFKQKLGEIVDLMS
jgi:hypothetical protein